MVAPVVVRGPRCVGSGLPATLRLQQPIDLFLLRCIDPSAANGRRGQHVGIRQPTEQMAKVKQIRKSDANPPPMEVIGTSFDMIGGAGPEGSGRCGGEEWVQWRGRGWWRVEPDLALPRYASLAYR